MIKLYFFAKLEELANLETYNNHHYNLLKKEYNS